MRMLIAVWLLFLIMWGPYLIYHTISSYLWTYEMGLTGEQGTRLVQTFGLLSMANSALNPLLYAFMSRYCAVPLTRCGACDVIHARAHGVLVHDRDMYG